MDGKYAGVANSDPRKVIVANRYFINSFPPYVPRTEIVVNREEIRTQILLKAKEALTPGGPRKSNGGVYVGGAGIAYMFIHVDRHGLFSKQGERPSYLQMAFKAIDTQIKYFERRKEENTEIPGFLLGKAGVDAVAAVLFAISDNFARSQEHLQEFAKAAEFCKPIHFLRCGGDELFKGRAGYLCAALWLQKSLAINPAPERDLKDIWRAIIESGKEYAIKRRSPSPLMYSYHDTEYLGAAHGMSSILQMLLSFPTFLSEFRAEEKLIRDSVDFFLSLQDETGNFRPELLDDGRSRDEKHVLVHFCHGAPGAVYLLAKAYLYFKDHKYLEAALRCGEVVWQKGLLRKGAGLCHGIAGNGYVFLLLYKLTGGDLKHYYRATKFYEFLSNPNFLKYTRTPDSPLSLFEGLAGTVCFLSDVINPQNANFPFFDVQYDYISENRPIARNSSSSGASSGGVQYESTKKIPKSKIDKAQPGTFINPPEIKFTTSSSKSSSSSSDVSQIQAQRRKLIGDKRYFPNNFPPFYSSQPLLLNIEEVKRQVVEKSKIALTPCKQRKSNGGVYVGGAGLAYMFIHVDKHGIYRKEGERGTYLQMAFKAIDTQVKYFERRKEEIDDIPGFLLGKAGVDAVAAVLFAVSDNFVRSQEHLVEFAKAASICKPIHFLRCGGDELFKGRAGYLCAALWLQKSLAINPTSENDLKDVWRSTLESGKEYALIHGSPCPLMYAYHDKEYLGAAHGLCSILYMLLSFPSFLSQSPLDEKIVRETVEFYLSLQDETGNFRPEMDESGQSADEKNVLVHFCHGAPGAVYLLAKAYLYFKDNKYLEAALRCGEVVWQKGLLRKGPGLCHGVAGNGYVFLLLFRLTNNYEFYYRAIKFYEFLSNEDFVKFSRTPDSPLSLFEGLAGTICFLSDVINPQNASFPFFDPYYDYIPNN